MSWWQKILDQYSSIESMLEEETKDYKKIAQLEKQLNQLFSVHKLAKQAAVLEQDNQYLKQSNDFDPDIAKEMIDENIATLKNCYISFLELSKPKISQINKLILEIRPGTGGDEASLFAENLLNMYKTYAEKAEWSFDILSIDFNDDKGIKNVFIFVEGENVYDKFKFEAGVHRVQRIPLTEANGRIHTSTATIAVLPESEDANVVIEEKYLRIDVFRAGGAGGQHVNKTESAVRLIYHPPNLVEPVVVSIQDEKSQHKNKAKAMKILKARVSQSIQAQLDLERASQRKSQVGKAVRSEKIRTYNFQQSRITDHRCKMSVYNLQEANLLLPEDLDKIIEALGGVQIDNP